MRKSFVFFKTLEVSIVCILGVFAKGVYAGDLEWSGVYRIEGNIINKPELDDNGSKKEYGNHHLILRPKIVAADGLTIRAQFDIFNSPTGSTMGPNQLGQFFGESGVNGTGGASTNNQDSNSMAQNLQAEQLLVSELYLTLNQEFGALIVGRAPVHFGLGMTHNSGRGEFDHWYDTRDVLGYKIVMGNLYFLPMLAKTSEGSVNNSDDVTEYLFQLQYENPETDMEMGVMYWTRKAKQGGNDSPVNGSGGLYGGTGAVKGEGVEYKTVSVYALKESDTLRFGLEAAFQDGKVGVRTSAGEDVTISATGIAGEFQYRPVDSNWKWGLNFGYATGDDPSTNATFEGYIFDRNYDVAMLLFNHPLGQEDFFRTSVDGSGAGGALDSADTESISNVLYFSPNFVYRWSDKYFLNTSLTTGWLNTESVANVGMAKDIGYELDFALSFEPKKGVRWVNQLGMLMPGSAFEGGTNNYDTAFTYGFVSKAAISF